MPADAKFEKPVQSALLQDETKVQAAQSGADIHCAFCGARNPAGTAVCSNCGADLKEGKARAAGQVVGAFDTKPVPQVNCPNCNQPNSPESLRCANCGAPLGKPASQPAPLPPSSPSRPNLLLIGGIVVAVILLILLFSALFRTNSTDGVVSSREWQRVIAVEQFGPVKYNDWKKEIPSEGKILQCEDRYYTTSSSPAPQSTEVCGTPYSVDKGNGYSEVVQDCSYEVYAPYCSYTVDEWSVTTQAVLTGSDAQAPAWPNPSLSGNQRLGSRGETYKINFETSKGQTSLTTSDAALYDQAAPGSRWSLTFNGFGSLVDAKPAP